MSISNENDLIQIECGAKLQETDLVKTKDDLLKAGYLFPLKWIIK